MGSFQLGAATEILKERLGPPVRWRAWWTFGDWHYPHLGVRFETGHGKIEEITLVVREGNKWGFLPGREEGWRSSSGLLRFPDGSKASPLEVSPGDFVKHVGEPDDREDDEVEIVLDYEKAVRLSGFSAEFAPQGELTTLRLYSTRD